MGASAFSREGGWRRAPKSQKRALLGYGCGVPSPGKYELGGQWSAGAVDFGLGPERFAQGSIYKKAILVESAAPPPGSVAS